MTKASTVLKKSTFQKFSHLNALGSKFDLDIKYVKVNLGSSFEQTSPMLHTKSQGHQPSGSGEEIFYRVFTIYGRGGHLGHVTKIFCMHFG